MDCTRKEWCYLRMHLSWIGIPVLSNRSLPCLKGLSKRYCCDPSSPSPMLRSSEQVMIFELSSPFEYFIDLQETISKKANRISHWTNPLICATKVNMNFKRSFYLSLWIRKDTNQSITQSKENNWRRTMNQMKTIHCFIFFAMSLFFLFFLFLQNIVYIHTDTNIEKWRGRKIFFNQLKMKIFLCLPIQSPFHREIDQINNNSFRSFQQHCNISLKIFDLWTSSFID